jgi:hypothetical protein
MLKFINLVNFLKNFFCRNKITLDYFYIKVCDWYDFLSKKGILLQEANHRLLLIKNAHNFEQILKVDLSNNFFPANIV